MFQLEKIKIPEGSIIGIEGGPTCGKTLLSLNLMESDKICFVDLQNLDRAVFKNQNPRMDFYHPPHLKDLKKFIKDCNYDLIILDTFTKFTYNEKTLEFLYKLVFESTGKNIGRTVMVFDNMSEKGKFMFKNVLPMTNLFLYVTKDPVISEFTEEGAKKYLPVMATTLYRLFTFPTHLKFTIDIEHNKILETDYLLETLLNDKTIVKESNTYTYRGKKYVGLKNIKDAINQEYYSI